MSLVPPGWEHFAAPVIVFATAMLVFIVAISARRPTRWLPALSVLGLGLALVIEANTAVRPVSPFSGVLAFDGLTHVATLGVIGIALAVVIASASWMRAEPDAGDYYTLLLFATFGALLLASAADFTTLFLGLEAASLPLYALVAFRQSDGRGPEGALKYFLLGAFAAAIMVFGMSLLYGASGTTRLADLGLELARAQTTEVLVILGLVLTGTGLAFKLGVAPFHSWVMDAYEASMPAVAGTLATLPKIAALAALIRLLDGMQIYSYLWMPGLAMLAILSMAIGNFGGLRQKSVARLLGYSSVAQTGYVLVGLAAGTAFSFSASITYFAVYSVAALGAFLALGMINPLDSGYLEDLSGLGKVRPALGVALGIFMLSLVGIPPLAGFFGKLALFTGAIAAGYAWLAVIALLFSVVSLGYYGAVLREIFLTDGEGGSQRREAGSAAIAVAGLALIALLVAFVPGYIFTTLM